MNVNELADELDAASSEMEYNHIVSDWKLLSDSATMLRQQQAEIEALQSVVNGNKEVMADWEAEVKSVREMNTICWRSNRKQQAKIEALKTELHKYKPQIWEVMKEANK
jgi:chromosome segregation ATPase